MLWQVSSRILLLFPGAFLPWFPLEIVGRFTNPIDPIRQGIASSITYVSRRKNHPLVGGWTNPFEKKHAQVKLDRGKNHVSNHQTRDVCRQQFFTTPYIDPCKIPLKQKCWGNSWTKISNKKTHPKCFIPNVSETLEIPHGTDPIDPSFIRQGEGFVGHHTGRRRSGRHVRRDQGSFGAT